MVFSCLPSFDESNWVVSGRHNEPVKRLNAAISKLHSTPIQPQLCSLDAAQDPDFIVAVPLGSVNGKVRLIDFAGQVPCEIQTVVGKVGLARDQDNLCLP